MWPFEKSYSLNERDAKFVADILQEHARSIRANKTAPTNEFELLDQLRDRVRLEWIDLVMAKLPEASLPDNVIQFPVNTDDPPKAA